MAVQPSAPAADLPRVQAGGSPQHLLLTLLGDYWYGQRAPLPSAALVALLGEFGITEVSARATLSRLARRGLLELSRTGRRTSYALSARAAEVLTEGRGHILSFGTGRAQWSGRWTVAAFSVPEDDRSRRHALRTRLGWYGFAPLYDGLWVSPHERVREVTGILTELGIDRATVFTAELAEGGPVGGHPVKAWDLDALRAGYERLLAAYEPVRQRWRGGRIGTAEALVARTALMDDWRTMPSLDPELPTELLPARWPRSRARELFVELYDGLAGLAEQRVVQVVAEYDPALAALVRSHTSRCHDLPD
ncbi:PaaX family transcriptional regulator C-terminal domain-containing protein [Micromonospora sp. WMMD1102]|uniref:PaaX family transcriptional regulator n=1 Tax=Micromonospora sp. WMMD1102 TaxID=3016105 RepID=UPI00241590FE|nr:PaaX family transcriptional regulator C-terminal domain-containing protein [Micromonospora sp. WMMD1102]MDG4785337.1 PaaX family transcriptional regulator C-terminal domain-containing protein [Micromonospora sp. WMMD1102]